MENRIFQIANRLRDEPAPGADDVPASPLDAPHMLCPTEPTRSETIVMRAARSPSEWPNCTRC